MDTSSIAYLILENLPMGILFCDRNGIVRLVNRAYASILAQRPEGLVGRHITDIIPHSRAHTVMDSGKPEMGEFCQLGPGNSQPVIVNRLPVRDADGNISGMVSQALFHNPDELQRLSSKIEHLGRKLSQYKSRMAASLAPKYTFASILGESESISRLKRLAQSYAMLQEPVLILGATGSGKELFAHAVHSASPRRDNPFVCINCAAIPKDLFESELFGYDKGAFSGARQEGKIGQMELADKGTLFLDEIGEMPTEIQAKLLRVLESRSICRLGSVTARNLDFRLIAATNRNIGAMLEKGAFREDLYYRINTFVLDIPPLCQRREDIVPITRSILHNMDLDFVRLAPQTEQALRAFSWPGNVRQLHNAVVHAATMRRQDVLMPEDFPPETLPSLISSMSRTAREKEGEKLSGIVANAESLAICSALQEHGKNVSATARFLKISRAALYEKMRKHGIDPRSL